MKLVGQRLTAAVRLLSGMIIGRHLNVKVDVSPAVGENLWEFEDARDDLGRFPISLVLELIDGGLLEKDLESGNLFITDEGRRWLGER